MSYKDLPDVDNNKYKMICVDCGKFTINWYDYFNVDDKVKCKICMLKLINAIKASNESR